MPGCNSVNFSTPFSTTFAFLTFLTFLTFLNFLAFKDFPDDALELVERLDVLNTLGFLNLFIRFPYLLDLLDVDLPAPLDANDRVNDPNLAHCLDLTFFLFGVVYALPSFASSETTPVRSTLIWGCCTSELLSRRDLHGRVQQVLGVLDGQCVTGRGVHDGATGGGGLGTHVCASE